MSDRLAQVNSHLTQLSISRGPTDPPLLSLTIGEHLSEVASRHPHRLAVVSHWQKRSLTYSQLDQESKKLAGALFAQGISKGDRVAIFAGNCIEYVLFFFASARLGALCVVLNPAYTPKELRIALDSAGVKLLAISITLGAKSLQDHIDHARKTTKVVLITKACEDNCSDLPTFHSLMSMHHAGPAETASTKLDQHDTINMQFTSGTTGNPKASCLTHHNLLNNGLLVGRQMALTDVDILCVPVPLFHCFGLVLGNMAAFTHSCTVVYPSEIFQPRAVLEAIQIHKCTALHGVPTMFIAILDLLQKETFVTNSLRTGIAAGTVVNPGLMKRIQTGLGLADLCITYGQTETSPASTMTSTTDPILKRTTTVGRVLPHTTIKIVDQDGTIVPRGVAGEVYTSGYLLHAGYWRNQEASDAAIRTDEHGPRFMKTGDMGVLDEDGYLQIRGRLKDLIIRGGENISPSQIEDELAAHPSISDVSVVGISDDRYGEVAGAFIILNTGHAKLSPREIRGFCEDRQMAHYRIPVHVFTMGDEGLAVDFPKTMSGKIQKYILRRWGDELIRKKRGL